MPESVYRALLVATTAYKSMASAWEWSSARLLLLGNPTGITAPGLSAVL